MVHIGENCKRRFGYDSDPNFGYGVDDSYNSNNMFSGIMQSGSVFGMGSNSNNNFFNTGFNNGFNNGFTYSNNYFNNAVNGGFTFSNFEGVDVNKIKNGVSWNNMNNPALYKMAEFDSPSSGFKALDDMLKPLPNVKFSDTNDFNSYSMYGSGASISYIDNLTRTIPVNFNFGSSYSRPFSGGTGVNNQNYSNNSTTPFISSTNGIYDHKAYQQYLDSVWGTNYANSIASAVQNNQNKNKNQNQQTQKAGTQNGTEEPQVSQEAQNLNKGLVESNVIRRFRDDINEGNATDEQRKIVDTFDERNETAKSLKPGDEYHDILAELRLALESNDEETAEEILNNNSKNLGELEQFYYNAFDRSLRDDIAETFPVQGLGWLTKGWGIAKKTNHYLNKLDENAAETSPFNMAMALHQALHPGFCRFGANGTRLEKLIDSNAMTKPEFARAVNDTYRTLFKRSFQSELNSKWYRFWTLRDLKSKVRKIFSGTAENNNQ